MTDQEDQEDQDFKEGYESLDNPDHPFNRPGARKEYPLAKLTELEHLYVTDRNVLHVWAAIRICRQLADEDIDQTLPVEEYVMAMNKSSYSLPDWVLRYLEGVSWNFDQMTYGRDPRKYPSRYGTQADYEALSRWRSDYSLSMNDAVQIVPQVLGLTRKGKNAFLRFARRDHEVNDFLEEVDRITEEKKKQGFRHKEILEYLMECFGQDDSGSFRRRVRCARKAAGTISEQGAKPRG